MEVLFVKSKSTSMCVCVRGSELGVASMSIHCALSKSLLLLTPPQADHASLPVTHSQFLGSSVALSFPCSSPKCFSAPLSIHMAISRQKKEETVAKVRQELDKSYLVAGLKFTGFTVRQMQELRRKLPEEVTLTVAKNTLVGKAIEGTKWQCLQPCLKGMNAWLFVHTEEISAALKPYRDMQKELKLESNDFTGAVLEGRYFAPEEFNILETMPTREEIYAKLLGILQGPSSNLVGVLQAPSRDLVLTLRAYVKKLEQQHLPHN